MANADKATALPLKYLSKIPKWQKQCPITEEKLHALEQWVQGHLEAQHIEEYGISMEFPYVCLVFFNQKNGE